MLGWREGHYCGGVGKNTVQLGTIGGGGRKGVEWIDLGEEGVRMELSQCLADWCWNES